MSHAQRVEHALMESRTWTALPDPNSAAHVLAHEVERLRAENERLQAELDRLRADMQEEGRATQRAIEDAMHRGAQAAAQDAHDLSGW